MFKKLYPTGHQGRKAGPNRFP